MEIAIYSTGKYHLSKYSDTGIPIQTPARYGQGRYQESSYSQDNQPAHISARYSQGLYGNSYYSQDTTPPPPPVDEYPGLYDIGRYGQSLYGNPIGPPPPPPPPSGYEDTLDYPLTITLDPSQTKVEDINAVQFTVETLGQKFQAIVDNYKAYPDEFNLEPTIVETDDSKTFLEVEY